jgi:hypothetical protein
MDSVCICFTKVPVFLCHPVHGMNHKEYTISHCYIILLILKFASLLSHYSVTAVASSLFHGCCLVPGVDQGHRVHGCGGSISFL